MISSSPIAIEVSNLTKRYKLYAKPSNRLREALDPRKKKYHDDFFALDGISFTVNQGETVGILGKNGAGKSTLLKLITGIITPTSGTIRTVGKIASLLELGAGFNPGYTGLENIYFQGVLMGCPRNEMNKKIDDILAFADIGEFIHQPVKMYSSGMFVRLAFAIIAHIDADILIIDEALSVGDAVFTQKCMRFIRDFQNKGTLLFVSHDTGVVLNICQKAILLQQGKIIASGDAKTVSENYLQQTWQESYGQEVTLHSVNNKTKQSDIKPLAENAAHYASEILSVNNLDHANGWTTGAATIMSVSLENLTSNNNEVFKGGEQVSLTIEAIANDSLDQPILGFNVKDRLGQELFGENTLPIRSKEVFTVSSGTTFRSNFVFTLPMLPNGDYSLMASVANGDLYNHIQHHWLHDAIILNVSSSNVRWGLVGVSFDKIIME